MALGDAQFQALRDAGRGPGRGLGRVVFFPGLMVGHSNLIELKAWMDGKPQKMYCKYDFYG